MLTNANIEEALNVFVRVNSGGEPLSLSDVLMSTAVAYWQTRDARKEILGLVDQIQASGFFIKKDLILKSCLYLYSSDIRYRVTNFSQVQVKKFEDQWDLIRASIVAVFNMTSDFGYNDTSLTSKNALLPIIYWVHHRGLAKHLTSQISLRADRDKIRRWLHTMLLKGIFGGSSDTILAAIRRAFVGDDFGKQFVKSELVQYPVDAIDTILRAQGKDPQVTAEFIDSLLSTQYEEKDAFTILALLAPNLDYKNGDFHKDHLHPASAFKKSRAKLRAEGVVEQDLDFYQDPKNWNSIVNLRHLDSSENKSKQDTPLVDWVDKEVKRQHVPIEKFCTERQLPTDSSQLKFARFREFIAERRRVLSEELRQIL